MTQWIAVSRTQHTDKHYLPRQGYGFAINQPVAHVLLAELPKLLPHYALGFTRQGEGYQPVALLSLDGQNNLYLHSDSRWIGGYVPASLRGYPFTLARSEQEQVLAIAADHLSDEQGEPLFDAGGNLSTTVQKTAEFLNQCEKSRVLTQQSTDALAQAGVLEPWPLQISRGEGWEPLKVNGLYRVNEKVLNALEVDAYAKLRGGPIALAYAQLFSMSQLSQLTERAKLHAQHATQGVPENLDSVLDGMDDDDDLTFDFDS